MKMIRSITFILFIGLLFSQCAKKVSEPMVETAKEVVKPKTFRSSAPAAGEARPINMGEFNTFELANGLQVISVQNSKLPRVSYQLRLKHQAIQEADKAGYVSFAGQLLNKGTKTKSKADIDQAIDFIGASMNTNGYGMFGSSLSKHQDALLAVMSDVLYNPTFPENEFEKVKKQTISGLAQAKSDPNTMASNVASALNYGKDHPFGEIQTEETVNNIKISDCKQYYDQFFRPNNAYLIVVGDITPDMAKAKAEKYFGTWQRKPVKNLAFNNVTPPAGRNVAFVNKDEAVQSVIRVTYPLDIKPGSVDAIPASVMNSILGGGVFSGRLMQNLREDKAFTYGARSSISPNPIIGNFNASASVRNEVTDSSVVEFIYELERLRDEPVSLEDLNLVKNYMTGSFARSLESPQTLARFVLNTIRYDLPLDYYDTYLQKLNAVTVSDVSRMAKKYIKPDNAYYVVVGNKDEVAEKLVRFDSDSKIDYYDAEGNVIEIKEVETPSDLTASNVIEDYLTAIGGKDKLSSLKSLKMVMGMNMMGQDITVTQSLKEGKMSMVMGGQGMVFMEQRFDGEAAMVSQMGNENVITEGPQFDAMKEQSVITPQLDYEAGGYTIELKGTSDVDGVNCYKVSVTKPGGKKHTEYYSVENSHLVRVTGTQDGPGGQQMTITTDFKDYKAVDGIMFPHTTILTGAAPAPMNMKVSEIELNPALSDDIFTVK